jgi:hypothetical protein
VGGTKFKGAPSDPFVLQRVAFSIPVFCIRNDISRPTYHRLRAEGRGPAEVRLGLNIIRITADAEREWQLRMQEPDQKVEAQALERAVKAGRAAIESAKHVSKRQQAREDCELKAAKPQAASPRRRTRSGQHQSQQVDIQHQAAMARHRVVKCAD